MEDQITAYEANQLDSSISCCNVRCCCDRDINAISEPNCPHFGVITMTLGLDHWTGHNSYTVTVTALLGYLPSYIDSSPPLN
eukprot:scaffold2294_cov263-Chaetoceros_neogracile.AAC.3